MIETVVATFMNRTPVTVTADVPFKQVACALLASDACALPVVAADHRPVGVITEHDVLANLAYHGGLDPLPLMGGVAARHQRRKASCHHEGTDEFACRHRSAATAPISAAVRRLATPGLPPLCVAFERRPASRRAADNARSDRQSIDVRTMTSRPTYAR